MSLWTDTDNADGKPKWLSTDSDAPAEQQKTNCLGADAAETAVQASSGLVAHQGWTVPAGGNGNTAAQRETLVCCHITGDASDDSILPDS